MNRVSTSSGLRLGYVYMALPVSGAAMVAFLLERPAQTQLVRVVPKEQLTLFT